MHVRKPNGKPTPSPLHTEGPALAGFVSRTTTGRNVVSGGSKLRSAGVPNGWSKAVAAVAVAAVALAAFSGVGRHSGSAQASVASGDSVSAFGGAPALVAPVVPVAPFAAIAASPTGRGYWVAAQDGGVFAFGDAHFYGSAGATPLNQPIVAIATSSRGRGYWLVARDGGVFAFGNAPFLGSVAGLPIGADMVGIASTPTRAGYWLVAEDGGVFSFGDATFAGSEGLLGVHDAVGLSPAGKGYWIARRNGSVLGFETGGDTAIGVHATTAPGAATVGIAARAGGGYWTVQAADVASADHMNPFLVCTRAHESSHVAPAYDTGYAAVNPSGTYRGAYQFSQSTWNNTALRAGRVDLVGVDPATVSVADQDLLALDLYHWQGAGPWLGRCSGL